MKSICLTCGNYLETSVRYPRKTCSIRCRVALHRSPKEVTPTVIPVPKEEPKEEKVEEEEIKYIDDDTL